MKPKTLIRTAYDGLKPVTGISFLDADGKYQPGRTEQCHKELCDIKRIVARHDQDGAFDHINKSIIQYGDYTEVNEFQESLNLVIKAQENFDGLPSAVRDRFANDPGKFYEFATNPKNQDELIRMGLADAPIVEEKLAPIEVVVTNPVAAPAATQ